MNLGKMTGSWCVLFLLLEEYAVLDLGGDEFLGHAYRPRAIQGVNSATQQRS
jgi:hypothetical protein